MTAAIGTQMLKKARSAGIARRVPARMLFALVATVALLLAPLVIRSGAAMAMAPFPDHQATAMKDGHCGPQSGQHDGGQPAEKSCCLAMCTAIASLPGSMIEPPALAAARVRPPPDLFRHGFLAKLPTPPPRLA